MSLPATSRPESVFGMSTSDGPTFSRGGLEIVDDRIEQEARRRRGSSST